jgi:hypothetical protein
MAEAPIIFWSINKPATFLFQEFRSIWFHNEVEPASDKIKLLADLSAVYYFFSGTKAEELHDQVDDLLVVKDRIDSMTIWQEEIDDELIWEVIFLNNEYFKPVLVVLGVNDSNSASVLQSKLELMINECIMTSKTT